MKTLTTSLMAGLCALVLVLASCKATAPSLYGTWDNGAGQHMIFQPDGQALWVINDPVARDTFRLRYNTNFSARPPQLDLLGFDRGPLNGRNLYGIVEFNSKKTMVVDFEPGPTETVRPTSFNPTQAQTYSKKKK
jgi:hypothetical protein